MESCLALIVLLCTSVLATEFPIHDCGSKHASVSKLTLSCPGQSECILRRNQNVTFKIEFTPTEDIKSMTAVVHGIIEGIPVPFPLPNPDACKDSGLKCPLVKNKPYTYLAGFFVKSSYPKVRVEVKWEMYDENKADVICILIPARIV